MMPFTRTLLVFLLASSLFFSGCLGFLGDDAEVEDQDDDMDHSNMDHSDMDHDDDNATDDGDPADNGTLDPPVASLTANVTEGAAPLAVSFTLEAEHDDPEGLTWSLDIGDDVGAESGDGLPATVNQTFDAAGNFTVVLTVSHGETSDEANVTITVTESAAGPNELQEGTNGLCLDYNVLYEVPGAEDPLATQVDVAPGTGIEINSDEGFVFVDFFDADGASVGYYPSDGVDTVPESAVYGIVCVGLEEGPGYPAIPVPNAAWTYQDGF